ncbi:HAD-IC family P-type ATPase [Candidatus Berkelbacteria bacterium]|nr:HAD-IC family P-type ATPase [Candidatus Berkelbacteria bacterium]
MSPELPRDVFWQSVSVKHALDALATQPGGLSTLEARRRQRLYGLNQITPPRQTNQWQLFYSQFTNPLVYVLIITGGITFFLGRTLDATVIFGILLANALIGYVQERKAEESLAALQAALARTTRVLRNHVAVTLPVTQLVPGDSVELSAGMTVPADIRLVASYGLTADESMLTGESASVSKQTRSLPSETPLAEQANLLFAGTIITSGRGDGVVIRIGMQTEFGKISTTVEKMSLEETPLNHQLETFSKALLLIILAIVALIALIGVMQNLDPVEMFFTAVAAAVSAIPEGLPAGLTIALAVGVQKMAHRHAIVRKLAAVETLGALTVIATDKTGTLTENQLVVREIYLPNTPQISVDGESNAPHGKFKIDQMQIKSSILKRVQDFLRIGILANDAIVSCQTDHCTFTGDPTEGALVIAGLKIGLDPIQLRTLAPRNSEIPFDSKYRLMATLHGAQIAVKGSVETILDHSRLTPIKRQEILKVAEACAARGYRLLAFAEGRLPAGKNLTLDTLPPLTYLGFVAMSDSPRPGVAQAIQQAKLAGVRVLMVTGDSAATAQNIAVQLKIASPESEVFTEKTLNALTVPEFSRSVRTGAIFAEVSPEMKLRIVEMLIQQGEIVGVTGDGVNDAPILKRAHVGIAMGKGGTDIARESADLVLRDNSFATIIQAIEGGRIIFANIRRSIWYLLSTNSGELLLLLLALGAGLPLPLLPIQILWINVVTDGIATVALALEPAHAGTLKLRPRALSEPLLTQSMLIKILALASVMAAWSLWLFTNALESTQSLTYARSVAFASISLLQVINIFNARSLHTSLLALPLRTNPIVLLSAFGSFLLTLATLWSVPLQTLFNTQPITLQDWGYIALGCAMILATSEIIKRYANSVR